MNSFLRSYLKRAARFRRDSSGTSAVEFAFILPIMVVLYFGCVEVSDAVSANRKVTAVASSVGDLVAQASSVDSAAFQDIFKAAEAVISPYPTAPLKIVVTSIWIDDSGNATVLASEANANATKRVTGSAVTVPAGLIVNDSSLIMAEVDYVYTSVFADFFSGPIPLKETFFLRPRKSVTVQFL